MAKPPKLSTPTDEAASKATSSPTKWWQWLLVYPGLLVAIVGAVPTYLELVKSYRLGVPFGQTYDAQTQNRLWQDNFACTQTATFTNITNKQNVEIGSAVCDSGDVLLRGKRPEWTQPQFRWVSWSDVAAAPKARSALLDFFPAARAAEVGRMVLAQAPAPRVICQRWVGNGQLLQRISTPNGCFDQTINTYSGWVTNTRPAPCNMNC